MLKCAMYILTILMLIASITIFIFSCIKRQKRKTNIIAGAYFAIIVTNWILLDNGIVDIGWDMLLIAPMSVIAIVFLIAGVIIANGKKMGKEKEVKASVAIISIIVPMLIFLVPFIYEASVLNQCSYLVTYNYQNGIITSDYYYIAIADDKAVSITLDNDFWGRESTYSQAPYTQENAYHIKVADNGTETVEKLSGEADYSSEILAVYENVKKKFPTITDMHITYLAEEQSAIFTVRYIDNRAAYKEYFCHGDKLKEIKIPGNIYSIDYFE